MPDVRLVPQFIGQALHIVVVREGIKPGVVAEKDIENGQVVVVRRDTREKIVVAIDEITTKLGEILETIQADLYAKAKAFLDDHISSAVTMDEMKDAVSEKKGFVKAMWCGDEACEDEIKAQTGGVTSRCIPMEEEHLSE